MEVACQPACSRVGFDGFLACQPIGPHRAFQSPAPCADEHFHSLSRSRAHDARLGSDLESRFWLSYLLSNRKTGPGMVRWTRRNLSGTLRMTASQPSHKAGAVATCACRNHPLDVGVTPVVLNAGSAWTWNVGRFRRVQPSCPSAVTSVSESPGSFGFIPNERRNDEHEKTRAVVFAGLCVWARIPSTDQRRVPSSGDRRRR